jgi:hypothetical protein
MADFRWGLRPSSSAALDAATEHSDCRAFAKSAMDFFSRRSIDDTQAMPSRRTLKVRERQINHEAPKAV